MYKNPALTVDAIVSRSTLPLHREILLIKRGREPFKNCWAFPGGFVDYGEDPKHAVLRELLEETNLVGENEPKLICVKGNPERDPRQHVVTIAYSVQVKSHEKLKAGDDACDFKWVNEQDLLNGLEKLAFDHLDILKEYSLLKRQNC